MKTTDDNKNLPFQMTGGGNESQDKTSHDEYGNRGSEMGNNQNYSGGLDGENTFTSLGGWDYYDLEED
jgi:hypothetical protein